MTGGRLKRVLSYIGEETFCFTYGDGVGDVDITATIGFHRRMGRLATVTAVQPPGRFGVLDIEDDLVRSFVEKPRQGGGYINGGYFVLEPGVGRFIEGDATLWERSPMERLASERQLAVFHHGGFWQPMDALRDKQHLEELWVRGEAPWKKW
jgi:glucose-1-phosphate cytidylyltransferase